MNDEDEGRDGARSGPGRWHGLPMQARNRIAVPRGIVDGHPADHSGAAVRALDIFDRHSRSKMARADTFCSQGRGARVSTWQIREHPQVFGHQPRPDAHFALVRTMIHSWVAFLCWPVMPMYSDSDTPGALPRCVHCMFFLFTRTLHLPARTLPSFVCLPACL